MTHLMNELISDKGVHRTAPATHGLLKNELEGQFERGMVVLER